MLCSASSLLLVAVHSFIPRQLWVHIKDQVNRSGKTTGCELLQDAMQSLSTVVDTQPDAQAAFNLVLCTFALGDKETMKQAFSRLVEVSTAYG